MEEEEGGKEIESAVKKELKEDLKDVPENLDNNNNEPAKKPDDNGDDDDVNDEHNAKKPDTKGATKNNNEEDDEDDIKSSGNDKSTGKHNDEHNARKPDTNSEEDDEDDIKSNHNDKSSGKHNGLKSRKNNDENRTGGYKRRANNGTVKASKIDEDARDEKGEEGDDGDDDDEGGFDDEHDGGNVYDRVNVDDEEKEEANLRHKMIKNRPNNESHVETKKKKKMVLPFRVPETEHKTVAEGGVEAVVSAVGPNLAKKFLNEPNLGQMFKYVHDRNRQSGNLERRKKIMMQHFHPRKSRFEYFGK